MQIIINHSSYNHADHYERIWGIIDFINSLQRGLFTDAELDESFPKAQEVYFVDYFNCEFENGSFHQYFLNSRFNKDMFTIIMRGLENMKAFKQLEIFKQAVCLIESMTQKDRELYLSPTQMSYEKDKVLIKPTIKKVHDQINLLADKMFEVLSKDPLEPVCYKYIESFNNLSVVKDDQYAAELSKILALVPNYEERKREADARWEKGQPAIAKDLCKKLGIELKSINVLDFGEDIVSPEIVKENYKKQRWYYHISTDKGYMYIVDDWNTATLYKGDTHEALGSITIQNEVE